MLDIDLLIESSGLYQTIFPEGKVIFPDGQVIFLSHEYKFVYRLLTFKEYRAFRSLRDGGVVPELLLAGMAFERCIVGNKVLSNDVPAGCMVSIGNLILYMSGDRHNDIEALKYDIVVARSLYPALSVVEHMKRIICTAFPAYKWEDLDGWTNKILFDRFAVSEQILAARIPDYKPLDVTEIKTQAEMAEEKRPQQAIDFDRENAAVRKATGMWAEFDAEESASLTREQVAKMKARQRGR